MGYKKLKHKLIKITALMMVLCMVFATRPMVARAEGEPEPSKVFDSEEYTDNIVYQGVDIEGDLIIVEGAVLGIERGIRVQSGAGLTGDGRLSIRSDARIEGLDLYNYEGDPIENLMEEAGDSEATEEYKWLDFMYKDGKWTRVDVWSLWEDPEDPLPNPVQLEEFLECDIYDIGPGVNIEIPEGYRMGVRESLVLHSDEGDSNRATIIGAGILAIQEKAGVEGIQLYDAEGTELSFPMNEEPEEWHEFSYNDAEGKWVEIIGSNEHRYLYSDGENQECNESVDYDILYFDQGVTLTIANDVRLAVRGELVLEGEGDSIAKIIGGGTLVINATANVTGITLYEESGPVLEFPLSENSEQWFEFKYKDNQWKHDDSGGHDNEPGNEPGNEPQENKSGITLAVESPFGGYMRYIATDKAITAWDDETRIEVPSGNEFIFWPTTVEGWRFDGISVRDSEDTEISVETKNEIPAPAPGNYIIRWDEDCEGEPIQVKCGIVDSMSDVKINELNGVEAVSGTGTDTKKTATGSIDCELTDKRALNVGFILGTNADGSKDTIITARVTRNGEIYEINDRMATGNENNDGWSFSIKNISSSDSIIVDFFKRSPEEVQCYKFTPEQNKEYTVSCNFVPSDLENEYVSIELSGEEISQLTEANKESISFEYSSDNADWQNCYCNNGNPVSLNEHTIGEIRYLKVTWDEKLYSIGSGNFGSFKIKNGESFEIKPGRYTIYFEKKSPVTIVWSNNVYTYGEGGTVTNGRVEIVQVKKGNVIVAGDNGLTGADGWYERWWTVNEEGGHCQLREGEIVTMRFIPDYGYQLKSAQIADDVELIPDDGTTSQFTFTVGSSNIHLKGVFIPASDEIKTPATKVNSASVGNADNATDSGNIRFTVTDTSLTQEFSNSNAARSVQLLDGYSMDLSLQQIVSKGTPNSYWVNDIKEFSDKVDVTLDVGTGLSGGGSYYVIREHKNPDGSVEYDKLPATYNRTTGEITFETNKFSTYALGVYTAPYVPSGPQPDDGSTSGTGEADNSQGIPDDTKPSDTEPDDTTPDDTKPSDTEPDDTTPDEKKELEEGDSTKTTKGENVTVVDATGDEGKTGSVSYDGAKSKKEKKVSIGKTTVIDGATYKIVSISDNAFRKNKYLEEVSIGKNVREIGTNAFYKCANLVKVKLGSKVSSLGINAFRGCNSLESIELPASVKKIDARAFYNCSSLSKIVINSTKLTKASFGENAFKGINKNAVIYVPEEKVGEYAKYIRKAGAGKKVKIVAIKN